MVYLKVPPTLQIFLKKTREHPSVIQLVHRPHQTVKDMAESCGIPHVEIGGYYVDGERLPDSARISDGATVVLEVSREIPDGIPRFVLDVHLTRLARYLRILGFDCRYDRHYEDGEIADLAYSEGRIVLTRDRGLLKRAHIRWGYWVRSQTPLRQLRETADRYNLSQWENLKSRCSHCNSIMEQRSKELVEDHLPRYTRLSYDVFYQCTGCSQLYWEGAHFPKIQELRRVVYPS